MPNAEAIIRAIEAEQMKGNLPEIHVGDTIKVGVLIQEGGKERVQPYEGVVIAKRNSGINATITVRRVFQGVGVERVFLLHSPRVESIKIIQRGRVRRAKLYYLRDRVGKATRIKQRFDRPVDTNKVEGVKALSKAKTKAKAKRQAQLAAKAES
ncbi:50S ribosomal protein L19 [Leptolyngbya sp. FACHB-261]|nr:50S ribosomal protein L19 [Leptolyngbya sp. FACHB-261]